MTDATTPGTRRQRLKRIARLGVPFVLGAVAVNLSGTIDTAMMGRYGEEDLAAVAGASAVFDVFGNLLLAAAAGYQILAARFVGADDPGSLRTALRASVRLLGALAALLLVVIVAAPEWLAGLVLDDPALSGIGGAYMVARSPSLLAIAGFTLLAAPLNSFERPGYALKATLVATGVNAAADLLLIYGLGPVPEYGAVGNGLATTIAWAAAVAFMLRSARSFGLFELLRREPRRADYDFETRVLTLSWPAMASGLLDYASIAVFFAIIAAAGQAALGGARIAFEMMVLVFAFLMAFSAASRILIGRSLGGTDVPGVRAFWRDGQLALLGPACLAAVLFVVARQPIALLFTDFDAVIAAAGTALAFVGVSLPLMGLTLGSASMLLAAGRTKWNMYANLAPALLVQLPVGYALVSAGYGIGGAFTGVVAYWVVRYALTEALAGVAYRREEAKATEAEAARAEAQVEAEAEAHEEA